VRNIGRQESPKPQYATELKIGECCNDFGTTTNLSGKSPCELFFVSWVVLTDSLDCIVARDQLERVYAELLVR
jgi:hypothetical protein